MTNEDKINNMTNAELLLYMYSSSNKKCESLVYIMKIEVFVFGAAMKE